MGTVILVPAFSVVGTQRHLAAEGNFILKNFVSIFKMKLVTINEFNVSNQISKIIRLAKKFGLLEVYYARGIYINAF